MIVCPSQCNCPILTVTGGRECINRRVEARRSSSNKRLELYLDFFPAIVATMLRSASNNAVAGSPSSTRRDKAKERREIVSSGERHTYTSLRLPIQSTIPRALWWCNTPAGQQRDNLCGVENLLRNFFLSLFVQFRREIFLAQHSNPQNRRGKAYLFFLLISILLEMFLFILLLLCQNISRVVAKVYWNKQSSSRRLDWSPSCGFFSSAVSDQGTYNWWQNFRGNWCTCVKHSY